MQHRYRGVTALEARLDTAVCPNCDPDIPESPHCTSVIQGPSKLTSKGSLDTRTKNVPLIQVRKVVSKATVWNIGETWPLK